MNRVFLTASWRYLAMANYAIDPAVLRPLVPAGTELDTFCGTAFASIVGFRFLNTRLLGVAIPFHRDFEEVNLRFYVRRKAPEGWRRGVVFVREIVPRRAIAWIARTGYGEPYTAMPMRHRIEHGPAGLDVEYEWRHRGGWGSIKLKAAGEPRPTAPGSVEEFITEHYWGYTAHVHGCSEYQVEHPRWRVWDSSHTEFVCDIASLYGSQFVECISAKPASAFIADGSDVRVRYRSRFAT